MKEKTQKFKVPHSLAIIIAVMLAAALLTYIIPGGAFDRVKDEGGRTVVVPGSYHTIERSPVNPLTILEYVFPGLQSAGQIIFALLCAGGGLGIVLATGMFQGAACSLSKKAKGKEWLVVAALMVVFALLCIPINLNYFIPFAPLGIIVAMSNALGFFPAIIQAPVMFFMHVIINFFVTSGSGQAAVTMPIFIPVADLVGMSRQTAVLALNFGDGFCNFILPHAAATRGFVGCANIPFTKWFKYAIRLFAIWCAVGSVLLIIASQMGY